MITICRVDNQLEPGVDLGLKIASPVGNLIGQVLFGWLADRLGRKRMCKSQQSLRIVLSSYSSFIRRNRVNDHRD